MDDEGSDSNDNVDNGTMEVTERSGKFIGVFILYIILSITTIILAGILSREATNNVGLVWTMYVLSMIVTLVGFYLLWSIPSGMSKLWASIAMTLSFVAMIVALAMNKVDEGKEDEHKTVRVFAYIGACITYVIGLVNMFM